MKRAIVPGFMLSAVFFGCSIGPFVQKDTRSVPKFSHVLMIVMENKDFDEVIGNPKAPYFNGLAKDYTLLTDYYAIRHASLPNYLAMISGDTFGVDKDCNDCFINAKSLPDLLEAEGRTWKTYQESLPSPGYLGEASGLYVIRHNPFLYFDPIRKDAERLRRSVVALTDLDQDLKDNSLPDYAFIMPNLCHSGHDCGFETTDKWLETWANKILRSSAFDHDALLVLTFDEGAEALDDTAAPEGGDGGRVATILVSELAKKAYRDSTRYSHYSLLKTIAKAWGLEELRRAADPSTKLILGPWRTPPAR